MIDRPEGEPSRPAQRVIKNLDGDRVAQTAEVLSARIHERFPGSGLHSVSMWVLDVARGSVARTKELSRPYWGLRLLVFVLLASLAIILVSFAFGRSTNIGAVQGFDKLLAILQSAIELLVFVGAAVAFLMTLEGRWKRSRMLSALHELRSMAHVVDMHQLTKDPERALITGPDTKSSPKRDLSPFLLSRYLDYCSELLSMVSKIAAQCSAQSNDPVVLDAVDQIETMTTGLSRKIWQKVMLLAQRQGADQD